MKRTSRIQKKSDIDFTKLETTLDKKTSKPSKKFRLRSTKFFLTYPQLPDKPDLKELALAHFETVFHVSKDDFGHAMSVELHEDGNPHLHAYLEFKKPQGIFTQNKLDMVIDGLVHHGNYQSVRNKHSVLQYILKSVDNPMEIETNIELPIYQGQYYTSADEHLYAVLMGEGFHSAVQLLYTMYPREAIRRGSLVIRNLELANMYKDINAAKSSEPKYLLNQFTNLPAVITGWSETSPPTKVLMLSGPSGTGKTELAKAIMHAKGIFPVFVRERQALKLFRAGLHTGIIFDDINPDDFVREELIHLFDVENPSQIRCLYGHVLLPAGLCKIFTTNLPHKFLQNDPALTRRVVSVTVNKSVVLASAQLPSLSSDPEDSSFIFNSNPVLLAASALETPSKSEELAGEGEIKLVEGGEQSKNLATSSTVDDNVKAVVKANEKSN